MGLRDTIKKNRPVLVLVLMVFFSFSTMWFSGKTGMVAPKEVGMTVFSFFQNIGTGVADFIKNTVNSMSQLSELRTQYDALLGRLQKYEESQVDIRKLQIENAQLKDILKYTDSIANKNVPAHIIGKDPGAIFSTITINKGFNDGIQQGMAVVAIQGGRQGLVGKIVSVGPGVAQVLPIFDAGMHVAARLERTRYEGLLDGAGSSLDELEMSYISLQAKSAVAVGDSIITSGLSSLYPADIQIGTVSRIESQPYESTLSLRVRSYIDFGRLEDVFVIMTPGEVAQ